MLFSIHHNFADEAANQHPFWHNIIIRWNYQTKFYLNIYKTILYSSELGT